MPLEPLSCRDLRVTVAAIDDAFGNTLAITCSDGRRLTIDTSAGAYGDIDDVTVAVGPGEEARVWVDAHGRIHGVGLPDARIHPVTVRLLEALDMDPDGAKAWGSSPLLWRTARLDAPAPGRGVVQLDGEVVMMVACEGFAVAHHDVTIHEKLPETTTAACAGRLLREVVSIPDLDHLDIAILHAERTPLGTAFTVVPRKGCIRL